MENNFNQPQNQFEQQNHMYKEKLPNATAVLVLGILSIIGSCCYGIVGFVLGIIGWFLANKDQKLYTENPSKFELSSNLKTGKILSIVGFSLSLVSLLLMIFFVFSGGMEAYQDFIQNAIDQSQNGVSPYGN